MNLIALNDVINKIEGPILLTSCSIIGKENMVNSDIDNSELNNNNCELITNCKLSKSWSKINMAINNILSKISIEDWQGKKEHYDEVVFACHPDQSLKLLEDIRADEKELLGCFEYQRNRAILHSDENLMPKNKSAWAAWNYLSDGNSDVSVSYWMNKLQHLKCEEAMIVSLNPLRMPQESKIHASFLYDHPLFNQKTKQAQKSLWSIQGKHNTWFCGAWCGHGFHEDGLQSGLLVAEAISDVKRPWLTDDDKWNSRIPLSRSFDGWMKRNEAA